MGAMQGIRIRHWEFQLPIQHLVNKRRSVLQPQNPRSPNQPRTKSAKSRISEVLLRTKATCWITTSQL